jgi:copper chaperone CopZ
MVKTIVIDGLSCAHCVRRVEAALNAIPGVKAEVSLDSKTASVAVPDGTADTVLTDAVVDAGYGVLSIE